MPSTMPNSTNFQVDFAALSSNGLPFNGQNQSFSPNQQQQGQYPTEYSIFVGDLAPEASNSDLVAVFRNPVLGLRNDREPKFIRPFLSCKSAKIMLDPVTGVSKGYGFVRFTDEADQQRALIEMHGLYCLSRPMRISPATTKPKPPAVISPNFTIPFQVNQPPPGPFTIAQSFSLPQNGGNHVPPSAQRTSPFSYNPVEGGSHETKNSAAEFSEESWKHHTQARAILGNLIGPNGEQLSNTDPYNTTVFVGGLSPLINEETLKTFFAPFGDIHYVKVPVGKNCGFVQFVRKGDAQRAIEKMQGFPIAGSRIRLSWGRSQYKAAQAAAQAAQTASIHNQSVNDPSTLPTLSTSLPQSLPPSSSPTASHGHGQSPNVQQGPLAGVDLSMLTHEQAVHLLRALSLTHSSGQKGQQEPPTSPGPVKTQHLPSAGLFAEEALRAAHLASREDVVVGHRSGVDDKVYGPEATYDPLGDRRDSPGLISRPGSGKYSERLQHLQRPAGPSYDYKHNLDVALASLHLDNSGNASRPMDSVSSISTFGHSRMA